MVASGHKQDAKLQEHLQRELKRLRQEGSNSQCADCSDTDTRFASVTLGIFLCNRCFGIHRALGAHLTRAKVLTLDAWSEAEVAHLAAVGNERSNRRFLARLPCDLRPPGPSASDREVERFSRRKYEERRWYSDVGADDSQRAQAKTADLPPSIQDAGGYASGSATAVAAATAPSAAALPDLLSLEPRVEDFPSPWPGGPAANPAVPQAKASTWLADFDPFAT